MSQKYNVFVREYAGDGYWNEYPPFPFDARKEAEDFVERLRKGEKESTMKYNIKETSQGN